MSSAAADRVAAVPEIQNGWEAVVDNETGRPYYYHKKSRRSVWSLEDVTAKAAAEAAEDAAAEDAAAGEAADVGDDAVAEGDDAAAEKTEL